MEHHLCAKPVNFFLIQDAFTPVIEKKIAEFGAQMMFHEVFDDDDKKITEGCLRAIEAGAEIVFCTGGMSVDPDDKTPLAIKNTGARIVSYGSPVLPGAMFLLSYYDAGDRLVPICGLPGCAMYNKRTIFDIVLPRLMARDYVVLNIRFTAIAFMERNGVTKEEFLAHIGKYGTNVHVQQDEVFEYFLSILQTAIDLRDEQNTNLSSKTLKKALAYIDEHYTSENLSLGTVACEVQVGANYLSSVFSQNMQKTFTEYISEKRMEKAKKLLKSTELPTSEIAAQVGYKDPHYFSFVFKKTQGCSPREHPGSI